MGEAFKGSEKRIINRMRQEAVFKYEQQMLATGQTRGLSAKEMEWKWYNPSTG